MSEFFKSYQDCKKFRFKAADRNDVTRIIKYIQNREYLSVPKDLLLSAN
jgi:hypothetical protein